MRLAATVIVVRDGAEGIQVLLVRRSSRSAFAPDAFVFPGGTVDPADYEAQANGWGVRVDLEFRASVPAALPTPEPPVSRPEALALVAAAVRELREEADIDVRPDDLVYFSHWITPPTEPRRYNTHFFIAPAPPGARGEADAFETHDAQWIGARDALDRYARGDLYLVYPTIKHLERLRSFQNVDALMRFARRKPIVTIMPDRSPAEGFRMPSELEEAW